VGLTEEWAPGDAAGLLAGPWERAHAGWSTWPDAVVCLRTAGVLHRFPVADDGLVHLALHTAHHHRGHLRAHRLALEDGETIGLGHLRVTTPARTAIDLLGQLPAAEAAALVGWVVSQRILPPDVLVRWLAGHPRARGNRQRRAFLGLVEGQAESPAEVMLHRLLHEARIEGWVAEDPLLEHDGVAASADVYFPDVQLVVEVDGQAAPGDWFQADRARLGALVDAGCAVLRFPWGDLVERPDEVVAQVRLALERLAGA
jgi:very-short-patch-repair endonuclease